MSRVAKESQLDQALPIGVIPLNVQNRIRVWRLNHIAVACMWAWLPIVYRNHQTTRRQISGVHKQTVLKGKPKRPEAGAERPRLMTGWIYFLHMDSLNGGAPTQRSG